jgi:predicted Zn-ribbon and HTH transcriptional regulator
MLRPEDRDRPVGEWAHDGFVSTERRRLIDLLTAEPRSASSLAREMGLRRGDIEEDLSHALRTAAEERHSIEVIPARCKDCGFLFGADRLRSGKLRHERGATMGYADRAHPSRVDRHRRATLRLA